MVSRYSSRVIQKNAEDSSDASKVIDEMLNQQRISKTEKRFHWIYPTAQAICYVLTLSNVSQKETTYYSVSLCQANESSNNELAFAFVFNAIFSRSFPLLWYASYSNQMDNNTYVILAAVSILLVLILWIFIFSRYYLSRIIIKILFLNRVYYAQYAEFFYI